MSHAAGLHERLSHANWTGLHEPLGHRIDRNKPLGHLADLHERRYYRLHDLVRHLVGQTELRVPRRHNCGVAPRLEREGTLR